MRANHSSIIRENSANSLALLKNVNNALPLKSPNTMALFGVSASSAIGGPGVDFTTDGTDSVYQGHLAGGSGSGTTTFPYLVAPKDALLTRAIEDGTIIRWIANDTWSATASMFGSDSACTGQGCGTNADVTFSGYSSDTEVCLVFLNAYSGEGADRDVLTE